MKITKSLALLMALLMLVSMVACTTPTPETPDDQEQPGDQPGDDKPGDDKPGDDKPEEDPFPGYEAITIAEALELCGETGNVTTERYYIIATVKTIVNAAYGHYDAMHKKRAEEVVHEQPNRKG